MLQFYSLLNSMCFIVCIVSWNAANFVMWMNERTSYPWLFRQVNEWMNLPHIPYWFCYVNEWTYLISLWCVLVDVAFHLAIKWYKHSLSNEQKTYNSFYHHTFQCQETKRTPICKGWEMLAVLGRQTDRHLYLVIKLRVVPSGSKTTCYQREPWAQNTLFTRKMLYWRCCTFYITFSL